MVESAEAGIPLGHPLIKKVPSLAGGDHIHLRLGRPGDIADRQGLRMRGVSLVDTLRLRLRQTTSAGGL
jgi:hypothetical protein